MCSIALPALAAQPWNCHTWSAELVLPAGASIEGGRLGQRRGPPATRGLRPGNGGVRHTDGGGDARRRDSQGAWLAAGEVRNPDESPGVYKARAGGSPLWLYPVTISIGVI